MEVGVTMTWVGVVLEKVEEYQWWMLDTPLPLSIFRPTSHLPLALLPEVRVPAVEVRVLVMDVGVAVVGVRVPVVEVGVAVVCMGVVVVEVEVPHLL